MKFQVRTGYALRILGYLYRNNNALSKAPMISEQLGITYMFCMKTIGAMKDAGFIRSTQGCNGGYQMTRGADEITVYDVIRALEGDFSLYQKSADILQQEEAEVKAFFDIVQSQMIDTLRRTTIKDLFDGAYDHKGKAAKARAVM